MSSIEVQSTTLKGVHERFVSADAFVCKRVPRHVLRRLDVDERFPSGKRVFKLYPYIKRTLDIAVALTALTLLSPLLMMAWLWLDLKNGGRVLERSTRAGLHCRPFEEYSFATERRLLRRLPVLFNILRGDMSFIGPRAACPGEMCAECRRMSMARKRSDLRPGLLCTSVSITYGRLCWMRHMWKAHRSARTRVSFCGRCRA